MKQTIIFIVLIIILYFINIIIKKNNNKEYTFLSFEHTNIYRGLATLMIIISHVGSAYGTRITTPLGGVGVAIFLISAGFGLNESYKKSKGKNFWTKKIFRVFFPYLLLICIDIIIDIVMKESISIPSYWYIGFIFFWYFVFYLLIKIPKIYDKKYIILGIISICVFAFTPEIQSEQAISFTLGIYISDKLKNNEKLLKNRTYIFLIILGITLLIIKQIPVVRNIQNNLIWNIIQLIMKLSFAFLIILLTYKYQKVFTNIMLKILGNASFEFYIVHYSRLLNLVNSENYILGMMLFVIFTFILSELLYIITKKVKKEIEYKLSKNEIKLY